MELFFVRAEFKKEKILKKVNPLKVTRMSTVKNYTTIYMANGTKYSVRTSLVKALDYFSPGMFIRINRSEVLSVYYIDNIARDHLIMQGKTVPIHRAYYKYVVSGISVLE